MAGAGLLALLDDIATLLDDISMMTKVAMRKTAGVLGDDLALNAEQVSGVRAERELPVIWAVFKGSLLNKAILVPAALAINALLPWLITPLLILGGLYLCYEGFEKVAHHLLHRKEEAEQKRRISEALADSSTDLAAFEKEKIKGAIRTDFVLSGEIIVITLGVVKDHPFVTQAVVVALVAGVITVAVYGLVAGIVKLDDAGLALLCQKGNDTWNRFNRRLGRWLLAFAPKTMKVIAFIGTLAMFLVGGGILVHNIPALHHLTEQMTEYFQGATGGFIAMATPLLFNALIGVLAGALLLAIAGLAGRFRRTGVAG